MFRRFSTLYAIFATLTLSVVSAASIRASGDCQEQYIAEGIANCPKMVPREDWGAKDPACSENLPRPVKYVVIHHTHTPPACYDSHNCTAAMRSMQNFHQDNRKWCDIGYNFAVGGDGLVYIGRGWGRVGAHAPPYNRNSIGVAFIGDWQTAVPNQEMLNAVKALIKCGVGSGFIVKDYKLIGHRQAKTVTVCPGEALFQEVQTWPHWSNEWINSKPTASPEIKLIETNSAVKSPCDEEKEETHYQVDRLRRRRFVQA